MDTMIKKILTAVLFCSTLAHADSVLLYNITRNKVEMSRDADQVRSIASITKIMTAMVTLDHNRDLGQRLMLSKRVPSQLPRQEYTREQLLRAMLINSDNAAAETLAENYPGGRSAFVARMNIQANMWDLTNTNFIDPSGLGVFNTSTARDVASLMQTANGYWFINEVSNLKQTVIEAQFKKKVRTINLPHTSGPLLFTFDHVLVSKTGLTNSAGWCVGMVVEQNQQKYVLVVLGSRNKRERLETVKDIRYNHIVDVNLEPTEIATNY
jgi:D-alanyl-D-alanine endopeptidase (penicillin-binding protein 7)